MYKQTDEVTMGSPLGSALASIVAGYYDKNLFSQTQKPPTYFRYVDDTFAIFDHEAESDEFLTKLNHLHTSLKFTFEKEENVYLFLMFTSKKQLFALKPVYTESPLSLASIYVGSHLVLSNVK